MDPDASLDFPVTLADLAALRAEVRRLHRQMRWLTVVANVSLGLALFAFGLLSYAIPGLVALGLLP